MTLATSRLATPSWDWAAQVEDRVTAEAALRRASIRIARIDGAISGTPFLVALVPAYVAVLWQQARMTMRLAALHGRDPREPAMAPELLALRGVHPTPEAAAEALAALDREPPAREGRRPLRTWIVLARRVLVLAGFLDPPTKEKRGLPWRIAMAALGGAIWVGTWVFPLTFMVLMAWSCDSATRKLATRATVFYAPAPGAAAGKPARPGGPGGRAGRVDGDRDGAAARPAGRGRLRGRSRPLGSLAQRDRLDRGARPRRRPRVRRPALGVRGRLACARASRRTRPGCTRWSPSTDMTPG
jgi:hypothetical protein